MSELSPGIIAILALFSIGGLVFLGFQAAISGNYISASSDYSACCTVLPWGSSPAGFSQDSGATNSELCSASELPNKCCVRAGRARFNSPVNLVSASVGSCSPELSYPGGSVCCTTESWKRSPAGFTQGTAKTSTVYCDSAAFFDCCAGSVEPPARVIGFKPGACSSPAVAYPFDPSGISACCSFETWTDSSSGYSQGDAKTINAACSEFESASQCCLRSSASLTTTIRLLGASMGACGSSKNYPVRV